MNTYNKKSIASLGIAAAIALTGPLAATEDKSRQDRSHQSQSQMHERGMGQRADSSAQIQPRSSSDIIGLDIQSATGDKIGQVDDLFIDMESGKIVAVVTSTGGLLGAGEQRSLLSHEDFRFDGEEKHLRSDLTKEQLKSAPRYREGETSEFDNVRPLGDSAGIRSQSGNRGAMTGQSDDRGRDRGMTGTTRQRETDLARSGSSVTAYQGDDAERKVHSEAKKMAVSDLVGMDVENRDGDNIGSIDKLYLDLEEGEVLGVVISTGGFLGMGVHQNVLALNELEYNAEEETLSVNLDREQLRSAPTYNEDDSSWHEALRERSNRHSDRSSAGRTSAGATARSAQTDSNRPTVFSQGNSSSEIKMTADIRSAIRDNDNMSRRAKNVTIITRGEKVILRGEVDSDSEKSAIEAIAREKAGNQNVSSELSVRTR